MKRPTTITEIMTHALNAPCIEPEQRVKCLEHVPRGMRHLPERPRNIWHRFPIVNGVKARTLMARFVTMENALLRELAKK